MTEERKSSLHPNSAILCEAYSTLYQYGHVYFPLEEVHIKGIDSTVKTVEATYYGKNRFETNELKASAYFCFLIKDHNLTDGNKRLALLWLEIYCKTNNLIINNSVSLDKLAVSVEQETISILEIIETVSKILFDTK